MLMIFLLYEYGTFTTTEINIVLLMTRRKPAIGFRHVFCINDYQKFGKWFSYSFMRSWFSTVTHTISFSGDPEFQKVFAALDELNLSALRSLFKEKHLRVMFIKHLVYRSFLNSWFYDNSLLRGLNTRLYFSRKKKGWRYWSSSKSTVEILMGLI